MNHCWGENIFVMTRIKQLLQSETGFGYRKLLSLLPFLEYLCAMLFFDGAILYSTYPTTHRL